MKEWLESGHVHSESLGGEKVQQSLAQQPAGEVEAERAGGRGG